MKYPLLVFVLLFAGMSSVQAQQDRRPGAGHNVKERILRIADKLEFSDEQRAETRELLQGTFADLQQIRGEMRANKETMKTMVEASGYDADAVAELSRVQGELFAQQLAIGISTRAAFNNILTDDQKARLEEFKAQREDRREFLREQGIERREYFRGEGGA